MRNYRLGSFLELTNTSAVAAAAEMGLAHSGLSRIVRGEGEGGPTVRTAAIICEWSRWKARQLRLKAQIRYQDLLPEGFDPRGHLAEIRRQR